MKKLLSILALFLNFHYISFAEELPIQIHLQLSQTELALNEELQAIVEIKQVGGNNLQLPQFQIPGTESFQQKSSSSSTKMQIVNGSSAAIQTLKKTLIPTQEGVFTIGPVTLQIEDQNGNKTNIQSEQFQVTVKAPLTATEKTKADLKKLISFDNSFFEEGFFEGNKKNIALGFLFLLAASGTVWYSQRQEKEEEQEAEIEEIKKQEDEKKREETKEELLERLKKN